MNRRQAKREACFIASVAIDAGLGSWEDYNGIDPSSPDGIRVAVALRELRDELHARGATPGADTTPGGCDHSAGDRGDVCEECINSTEPGGLPAAPQEK